MKFSYERDHGLLVVRAHIHSNTDVARVRLAVDTGAARTIIDPGSLLSCGFDARSSGKSTHLVFGGGPSMIPLVSVFSLKCLGQYRTDFEVASYRLPPEMNINGLLGLDFLEGRKLIVDLAEGTLELL